MSQGRLKRNPVSFPVNHWVSNRRIIKSPVQMLFLKQLYICMLRAMNTGHDGSLTTLHSNSPADAVMRLSTMVRFAADLPLDAIEAQIGSALDLIVQISRYRDGSRRISHICEIEYDYQERTCKITPLFVRESLHAEGEWHAAPYWLYLAQEEGLISAEEVQTWLQATRLLPPAA